ncbi:MAG: TIGR00645 family protein [Azospirillum sp.]|nr:TIGR00645 family protein [Azospirillum sp.]
MDKVERLIELVIFRSRWLLAPIYLGLALAMVALVTKFARELVESFGHIFSMTSNDVILMMLSLIDLSLVANLTLMVVFAGYENFVSKFDLGEHPDRPSWMGHVDFSSLKLKLIASIVAISGIHLLRSFMDIAAENKENLAWMVGIHMAFVVSGVLLALMDRIAGDTVKHNNT